MEEALADSIFRGDRIYLRPLIEADIDERYISWFWDEQVTLFLDSKRFRREDTVAYIRRGLETREYYMHAICLVEDDLHIGNVKIGPIDWKHMVSDLVTVIGDRAWWGKGIASEAIALGSRMAFETYGIRKLHGGMIEDNVGSIKAYLKGGWIIEGRLKGQYLVDGRVMDRVQVSCFNPRFFPELARDDKQNAHEPTSAHDAQMNDKR